MFRFGKLFKNAGVQLGLEFGGVLKTFAYSWSDTDVIKYSCLQELISSYSQEERIFDFL